MVALQSGIGIICRFRHNADFNRIIVYVNHAIDQIIIVKNGLTLVSVAEHIPHAFPHVIVILRIPRVHPAHESAQRRAVRCVQQQMTMVVHHGICQHLHAAHILEHRNVVQILGLKPSALENLLFSYPLYDDVIVMGFIRFSRQSGHSLILLFCATLFYRTILVLSTLGTGQNPDIFSYLGTEQISDIFSDFCPVPKHDKKRAARCAAPLISSVPFFLSSPKSSSAALPQTRSPSDTCTAPSDSSRKSGSLSSTLPSLRILSQARSSP